MIKGGCVWLIVGVCEGLLKTFNMDGCGRNSSAATSRPELLYFRSNLNWQYHIY